MLYANEKRMYYLLRILNAGGLVLLLVLIFKGAREFPGYRIVFIQNNKNMYEQKPSFLFSELISKCLKEHFFPRKASFKVVFIIEDHSSNVWFLEAQGYADNV